MSECALWIEAFKFIFKLLWVSDKARLREIIKVSLSIQLTKILIKSVRIKILDQIIKLLLTYFDLNTFIFKEIRSEEAYA